MAPFLDAGDGRFVTRLARSLTTLSDRREPIPRDRTDMLMAVSLGVGLLSTLATSFAFYWFVKMRRSFRHE